MMMIRIDRSLLLFLLGVVCIDPFSVVQVTTGFVARKSTTTTAVGQAPRLSILHRCDEEKEAFLLVRLQGQDNKNNDRDKTTAEERLRALGYSEKEIASTQKQARSGTKRNPEDANTTIGGISPVTLAAGLGVIVFLSFVFATLGDSANSPY
mmetsp:Transcript_13344/g.14315  ORF Transcript_13344/g.14315 Transcript_13344/m.14315 type:complete len:152 (-) Transcript_13344:68-523(-)